MELFTPGHLIVVAVVALVLFFGWKQLPDMARSLGRSLRVFKTEIKGMSQDDQARKDAETSTNADATHPQRAIDLPRADTVRNPASRPRPMPNGQPMSKGHTTSDGQTARSSDVSGRVTGP